jgi:transposase
MSIKWESAGIYLRTGYTDMRKQINSLAVLVEQEFKINPTTGDVFIFCGKNRRLLKVLFWDKNGFCLWIKRLEKDKFPWPSLAGKVRQIKRTELRMLLTGIDFFHEHTEIKYDFVS